MINDDPRLYSRVEYVIKKTGMMKCYNNEQYARCAEARGFTGHEHYADMNIINMNGRLYDPVIARFFSPDNFV